MQARDRSPRAVVAAAFLAIASTYVSVASFEFLLTDMQRELGFSTDSANLLAYVPVAASLLVVFLAGSLADRLGPRRPLLLALGLSAIGAALVGLAPTVWWVIVGRMLDGLGGVTTVIVALAVVNSSVTERRQRARVFAVYAALSPAVFIVAPLLSAVIVESAGWRVGVVPWVVLDAITIAACLRFVPDRGAGTGGELITPLLAGLTLVGVALAATSVLAEPRLAALFGIVGLVSLAALVIALRRVESPTLDLRWCRRPGVALLLVVIVIASMPNLFFYTDLLLQYRYNESLVLIATLLIVPQVCAVVGGLLSGPVSARVGAPRAAIGALLVASIACLLALAVTSQAPIWVPVLVLAVCAVPISFIVGPLADTLFSRAPEDASGSASAMDEATWNLGGVLGGALIGAVSFAAFQSRLADLLTGQGLENGVANGIAREVRDGVVVEELAARLSNPIATEALASKGPALLAAQSHTYVVMGLMSAGIYLVAALLMLRVMRGAKQGVADSEDTADLST